MRLPRKKTLIPSVALLVVYRGDRLGFVQWLQEMDEVCRLLPVHLFVYDMSTVDAEQLTREDVQQLRTPLRLLHGQQASQMTAYNALLTAVSPKVDLTLILDGFRLDTHWFSTITKLFHQSEIGLWHRFCPDLSFWLLVRTPIILTLKGFEPRYFAGTMYLDDLVWRVRQQGSAIGLSSIPVLPAPLFRARISSRTAGYYAIRNCWLFARLRLTYFQAVTYLLPRIIRGRWWRNRQAVKDGWEIFFNRHCGH